MSLTIPHWKSDSDDFHSRMVYPIPKNQQILFPLDEKTHTLDQSSQMESKYANLLLISQKYPHIQNEETIIQNIPTDTPKKRFDYKNAETNVSAIDQSSQKQVIASTVLKDFENNFDPKGNLSIPYRPFNLKEQESKMTSLDAQRNVRYIEPFQKMYKTNQDVEELMNRDNEQPEIPTRIKKPKKESLLQRNKKAKQSLPFGSMYQTILKFIAQFNLIQFLKKIIRKVFSLNPYESKGPDGSQSDTVYSNHLYYK